MQAEDWDTAIEHYERSLEVDDLPHAWLGLALATMETGGSEDEVVAYLERAMRMGGRTRPWRWRSQTSTSVSGGRTRPRTRWLPRSCTSRRSRATRRVGRWTPSMRRSSALAIGGWRSRSRPVMSSGHAAWQRRPVPAHLTLDIIDAWGGDAAALARVQEAALADPTGTGTALDRVEAERPGQGTRTRRPLPGAGALPQRGRGVRRGYRCEVADTCEPGTEAPSRTELHGLWAYRRDLPRQLLPRGVPCRCSLTDVEYARPVAA